MVEQIEGVELWRRRPPAGNSVVGTFPNSNPTFTISHHNTKTHLTRHHGGRQSSHKPRPIRRRWHARRTHRNPQAAKATLRRQKDSREGGGCARRLQLQHRRQQRHTRCETTLHLSSYTKNQIANLKIILRPCTPSNRARPELYTR